MPLTLGGVELPPPVIGPEGSSGEMLPKGELLYMADGTVVYDYVEVDRFQREITWRFLTEAEYTTILNRAKVATVQAYSPWEETASYNVVVTRFSHETQYTVEGTFYHCEMRLEEVGT